MFSKFSAAIVISSPKKSGRRSKRQWHRCFVFLKTIRLEENPSEQVCLINRRVYRRWSQNNRRWLWTQRPDDFPVNTTADYERLYPNGPAWAQIKSTTET